MQVVLLRACNTQHSSTNIHIQVSMELLPGFYVLAAVVALELLLRTVLKQMCLLSIASSLDDAFEHELEGAGDSPLDREPEDEL